MTRLNIPQPEQGEEPPDHRDHLVRHICAPGPANKQRPLLESSFLRVERKLGDFIQRFPEYPHWHPECEVFRAGKSSQVCKQELPDPEVGLVLLQDGIGFGLASDMRIFDLAHSVRVSAEGRVQDGRDGGVVNDNEVVDEIRAAEGDRHGSFCAPRENASAILWIEVKGLLGVCGSNMECPMRVVLGPSFLSTRKCSTSSAMAS